MPVSKKPRKKRSLPLPHAITNRTRQQFAMEIELPVRVALEALGKEYFNTTHLAQIIVHSEIVLGAASPEAATLRQHARVIRWTCNTISLRHESSGEWAITESEVELLRQTLNITIPWMREQRPSKLLRALHLKEKNKNEELP